jgi:zinc protease
MRKIILCATVLLAARVLPAADDLPKAETILDKFIEATGGKAAYEKNHSMVSTGTIEFVGKGIKGEVHAYHQAPDKFYSEANITGIGKVEQGSDGQVSWERSAIQGARIKDGPEKTFSMQAAKFNSDLHWRDIYKKVEVVGAESVEGKNCYKLELTIGDGVRLTKFFDRESNLLVKTMVPLKTPMGEFEVEMLAADYRKEGDILTPHKMTQKVIGQEFTITISEVKYNIEIPKSRFELPEDIKALLKK